MNVFVLSYDYSNGYEISLVWIVFTANSRILHDEGNTVQILGIRHPKLSQCLWPPLFQTINILMLIFEFVENLTSLSILTSNILKFL